jgi:mannose-6-phosphate isomerase-like protein (cupin superfamily)
MAAIIGCQGVPEARLPTMLNLGYYRLITPRRSLMDVADLDELMELAKRRIVLFGTDNFLSWMECFVPGEDTKMHYHAIPQSYLVLAGSGVIKGLKGERPVRKNEVLFLNAKEYYPFTDTGNEPLVLFGSRPTVVRFSDKLRKLRKRVFAKIRRETWDYLKSKDKKLDDSSQWNGSGPHIEAGGSDRNAGA